MTKAFITAVIITLSFMAANTNTIIAAERPHGEQTKSDQVNKSESLIFNLGMNVKSDSYVGDIYISTVDNQKGFDIFHLVFEPGSYNMWHVHPDAAQTLLILDGEGYYQEEGQPKRLIKRGDVITIPENVKHWHGSTPGSRLVHLSITEKSPKGHVEWKEKVTDENYSL